MRIAHTSVRRSLLSGLVLCAGLSPAAHAGVRAVSPADYSSHGVTCEFPVRLTHDCSIWQGASRPIALGDYRMSLAAGGDGRTILVSRLRPRPDHNGLQFLRTPAGHAATPFPVRVIEALSAALQQQGISLERMHPLRSGHRVAGYYLRFSDNAYEFLKQFTVLESEHWLPRRQSVQ